MDEELVTVRTYRSPLNAATDKMHLDTEGIPVFIDGENVGAWDLMLGNAIGGFIKLQVPKTWVQAAQKVLELHNTEQDLFENEPEPAEVTRCLSCGERMLKEETQCPACGWSYADAAVEAPAEGE